MNTGQLKRMSLLGLVLLMSAGLCVLVVWDQTRSGNGDGARASRQQATMSPPAEPAEPAEPPASDAVQSPSPNAATPAESAPADGEVHTLVM